MILNSGSRNYSKPPVETLEDQELDDFMNELIEVRDGIGKKLALARRFCCKSREKWERCDAVLDHIGHRILANPAFMEIFLSPISARFEVQFDALLNDL